MPADSPLPELRDAIAEVDRALLELLRRRMDLAAEVGRRKAERGEAIVVRDVEDRVLNRARDHAQECGVSEDVLAGIFQAIIRGSVERQHRVGIELREQRGERVLIVGAAGAMGGWFRAFLGLAGHALDLLDPALAGLPVGAGVFSSLTEIPDLDVYSAILVAVPLAATAAVVAEIVSRHPRGVIVEVASIKQPLEAALVAARAQGTRVLSLHPMFGPGKSPYEPLTFVLAAQSEAAQEKALLAPLLAHPYTHVVAVPFEHHDRLMGWLLGLAHLTGILFGAALTGSGIAAEELHACASTTFKRQAATALSVLGEDPDLYLDIQRLNPHRKAVYAAVRKALGEIEGLVEGRNREAFRACLSAARRALQADE